MALKVSEILRKAKPAPLKKGVSKPGKDKKLGAFLGVYLPTILTILGVIMYLRLGWLTGHLGLRTMLLVVVMANVITLITTLSFSSIATNSGVGVGGAYYVISRSLGLEIGGAIGLPLFLSQAFSVTLYAYGLAESLRIIWTDIPIQLVAFIIVIIVGFLALLGAGLALKTQIPILALVGISLLALTIGAIVHSWGEPFPDVPSSGELGLWAGFAIFFPAVTGMMAGLGLSGDLKRPRKAIPTGSLLAVLTGFAIYLIIPVILVLGANTGDLRDEGRMVWFGIAPVWLIIPGLWGAIFSSAVGSMLGAPRTLQALAIDRTAPRFLGRQTGKWSELLPGLVLSIAIALGAVFLGNLNAVAVVVTIFFLTTYGVVNIAAAMETLSGDPSWRPKIRVPWPINLLGGIACLVVIFLIEPIAGIIAIICELLIWFLLSRKEHIALWGDARRGFYESVIRWSLILLNRRPMTARNWRPHLLVFVSDVLDHLDLVRFGNWFSQGRGVVTVSNLIVGDIFDDKLDIAKKRSRMKKLLDEEGLVVFPELHVVPDIVNGITNVAQANGIASIQSNIVLLGWPKDRRRLVEFLRIMRRFERLQKSLIIGRIKPRYIFPREGIKRTIHIWWGGLQQNGDLMLLLAYLLTRNPDWRDSRIIVLSIAKNRSKIEETERYFEGLLPEIRIEAKPRVIVRPRDMSVSDLIYRESKDADVVLFGLASVERGEETAYARRIEELAGNLSTVFFVKNSTLFTGELITPEK